MLMSWLISYVDKNCLNKTDVIYTEKLQYKNMTVQHM